MKFATFILLGLTFFLLFAQCEQKEFSSIENQREAKINDFLDLSMNGNLLFDLYDAHELTILECEKIIQELNQGKEFKSILPGYLSEKVDLHQVYEYFYETARLTQELRRYNVTESKLREKIELFSLIKSNHENDKKERLITTRSGISFDEIDYKRCVRYAEDDYEDCLDTAVRRAVTTWGKISIGSTIGGLTAAGVYGGVLGMGVGVLFVGPISGVMDYGFEKDVCIQQKEKDLIRCEEKYK